MFRFFIILLLVLFIDFYVYQSVRTLTSSFQPILRNTVNVGYWLLTATTVSVLLLYALGVLHMDNKPFMTYLRSLLFVSYIAKLPILIVLLAEDIYRGVQWVINLISPKVDFDQSRSKFVSSVGLILGALPFGLLINGMVRNQYRFKLHKTSVKIKNLPKELEGLRIVQISDIHSGGFTFKEPIHEAIKIINDQKPDIVFFTGDLVNNRAEEMEPYIDIFSGIQSKYGVFSTLGNHDYGDYVQWDSPEEKVRNLNYLKQIHQKLNWNLLCNEHRVLDINGKKLSVIGVENFSATPRFPRLGDMKKAQEGMPETDVKLLLSHDPSHWDYEVNKNYKDVAVTFSGHTHGFQFGIEIPGFVKWSPSQYVYKEWAGLYQNGDQYLYVNRGLGCLGYPGRVGILPEITLMELKSDVPV